MQQGDLCRLLGDRDERLRCDVLFIDPPWGGPEAQCTITIGLGGVPLPELAGRLATCAALGVRAIAFKLPLDYELAALDVSFNEAPRPQQARFLQVQWRRISTTRLRKMLLAVYGNAPPAPPAYLPPHRRGAR